MGCVKSLIGGFIAGIGLVWTISVIALLRGGNPWLGIACFLFLIIPLSSLFCFVFKSWSSNENTDGFMKWRSLLFAFQGIGLAFWSYDLLTTFYTINVAGLAYEINPLGWPLGILGALAFYGPILVFSYLLLVKFKEKVAFFGTIPLTVLTVIMSSMNLFAGTQNFEIYVQTANLSVNVSSEILAFL